MIKINKDNLFSILVFGLISTTLTLNILNCERDLSVLTNGNNENSKPEYRQSISGRVVLENQTEYNNVLIYLNSLDRGVSSDSSGYYTLELTEHDTVYSGTFKIYFFVRDYEMDSALFYLDKGVIKKDTLDVDSLGFLPDINLKQIMLVEGWTDRYEYRVGDTLHFTARFTNISDHTQHIFISSAFSDLGHIGLYRNPENPWFNLTPPDPNFINLNITLFPGGYYEGSDYNIVPEGKFMPNSIWHIDPGEYVVTTSFEIKRRGYTTSKNMWLFF